MASQNTIRYYFTSSKASHALCCCCLDHRLLSAGYHLLVSISSVPGRICVCAPLLQVPGWTVLVGLAFTAPLL
jgi:hypothetical protein